LDIKHLTFDYHLLSPLWYAKNRFGWHVRQSQDEILEHPPVTKTVSHTGKHDKHGRAQAGRMDIPVRTMG